MYKSLIDVVIHATHLQMPHLKEEADLPAAFTHWLWNEDVNFKFRTIELTDLWVLKVAHFCESNGIKLSDLLKSVPYPPQLEGSFDFIDLFAGIGGFHLALTEQGGNCVFASEWDKGAQKTYFSNYGKQPFGDINNFTNPVVGDEELDSLIPDHDVLAAGFPCQPFSHAGVSARNSLGLPHGFECETQGTLFHSIARIVAVKQPAVVFMENVRNIVRHDNGATFNVIKTTMENLAQGNPNRQNYKFFHAIINSETVVSQRRIRCYMVCIREDVWQARGCVPFDFPVLEGEPMPLRLVVEATSAEEAKEYTISDALWQGHIDRTKRNIARNTGFTAHAADLDRPANTIVARYGKDGKECLVPQADSNPRKLTINECRALFGYPIDFKLPEAKTPAYKQLGNSVVVPVVRLIAQRIRDYLDI